MAKAVGLMLAPQTAPGGRQVDTVHAVCPATFKGFTMPKAEST
jgi:hypothetical protein